MVVTIEGSEMLIALHNGLQDRFDGLVSSLDGSVTTKNFISFRFFKDQTIDQSLRTLL